MYFTNQYSLADPITTEQDLRRVISFASNGDLEALRHLLKRTAAPVDASLPWSAVTGLDWLDILSTVHTHPVPMWVSDINASKPLPINKIAAAKEMSITEEMQLLRDEIGITPLAAACVAGRVDAVKVLMEEFRADPTACDNVALFVATVGGHIPVIELLLSFALEAAAREGHSEACRSIILAVKQIGKEKEELDVLNGADGVGMRFFTSSSFDSAKSFPAKLGWSPASFAEKTLKRSSSLSVNSSPLVSSTWAEPEKPYLNSSGWSFLFDARVDVVGSQPFPVPIMVGSPFTAPSTLSSSSNSSSPFSTSLPPLQAAVTRSRWEVVSYFVHDVYGPALDAGAAIDPYGFAAYEEARASLSTLLKRNLSTSSSSSSISQTTICDAPTHKLRPVSLAISSKQRSSLRTAKRGTSRADAAEAVKALNPVVAADPEDSTDEKGVRQTSLINAVD
ncbi:hypothetical protein BC829DRAFT_415565 [Chytridium lagenaria]|nr:hypothetical protein BC829DRAFT_415565 [Chytridium lagenaria]